MKRIIFTMAVAAGVATVGWCKPALKTPMRVLQPDGTTVTVVKRGDERSHRTFTLDGHLVVKDAQRGFVYATLKDGEIVASDFVAKDAEARTSEEKSFLSGIDRKGLRQTVARQTKESLERGRYRTRVRGAVETATRGPGLFDYDFPVKGSPKGLVILVEFSDVKFNSKNSSKYNKIDGKTYFTNMLNEEGFSTYNAEGSARDWFMQNSNGIFKPQFDVYGPVTLSQKMSYYGGNNYYGDDKNPAQMITDACKALDGQIDYTQYDTDGDGYVDNVYVFYAGYGEADSDEENAVWPHSWNISDATAPNDYVSGNPLKLDGVFIDRYACSNETMGYDENLKLANRPDGIGTFVHEFSHVMGLPDLYCTEDFYEKYEEECYKYEPFTPGEFSVMDYGPYNNGGLTPPNYSAYELYALDWITPEAMPAGAVTLENLADSRRAFIVKTDREQEYYLFENRQQTGWDKYIPASGMLVWHIDYDITPFYNNEVNNTKDHQYVDLVEADNIQDYPTGIDSWTGYYDYPASTQTGDPFPGSKRVKSFGFNTIPSLRSWNGRNLGVELTNIAEANGRITFNSAVSGSGVDDVAVAEMEDGDVFNLAGVKVGELKDGRMPELLPGVYVIRNAHSVRKIILGAAR